MGYFFPGCHKCNHTNYAMPGARDIPDSVADAAGETTSPAAVRFHTRASSTAQVFTGYQE